MLPRSASTTSGFFVRSERGLVMTCTGAAELVAKEMLETSLVTEAIVVDEDTLVLIPGLDVRPTVLLVAVHNLLEALLDSGAIQ